MSTVKAFDDMQILVKVVEAGSFTAAARELNLPKSSVSRKVTALERRLGVRLLHRTTRSLRLTAVGETYYERASRLLCELIDLESLVTGFGKEPVGNLRITCPSGFVERNSLLFCDYLEAHPAVRLQLEETNRYVDLVAEGFDLAFRGGRAPDPSLTGHHLLTSETIIVGTPDYLDRAGRPQQIKDLAEHELLLLSEHSTAEWTLGNGRLEHRVEVVSRLSANTLRSLFRLTCDGVGLALLPALSCRPGLNDGTLERVLDPWVGKPAELWMIYPTERQMASSVRAFLSYAEGWDFELI